MNKLKRNMLLAALSTALFLVPAHCIAGWELQQGLTLEQEFESGYWNSSGSNWTSGAYSNLGLSYDANDSGVLAYGTANASSYATVELFSGSASAFASGYAGGIVSAWWYYIGGGGTQITCSESLSASGEAHCFGFVNDWYCLGVGSGSASSEAQISASTISDGSGSSATCAGLIEGSASTGLAYGTLTPGQSGSGTVTPGTNNYVSWGGYQGMVDVEVWLSQNYVSASGLTSFNAQASVFATCNSYASATTSNNNYCQAEADSEADCSGRSSITLSF